MKNGGSFHSKMLVHQRVPLMKCESTRKRGKRQLMSTKVLAGFSMLSNQTTRMYHEKIGHHWKRHQERSNKQTGIWWYMYIGIYIYIYNYWCFGLVVFIPKQLAVWKNPRCLNSLETSQIWLLRTSCSSSFHRHRLHDKPIVSCWLSRSKFQFYPNKMVALIHRLCVFGGAQIKKQSNNIPGW